MGGDALHLVLGESDDPFVIAENFKMAIDGFGDVDLVLAGQQSADMDRGVVHSILAGMLGWPFLPQISHIKSEGDAWMVVQIHENGTRQLQFNGQGGALHHQHSRERAPHTGGSGHFCGQEKTGRENRG